MKIHYVNVRSVEMESGQVVDIKYWAGFDSDNNKVTAGTYSGAGNDISDDFYAAFKKSLIESLANTIENDLKMNPQIHYQP